MEKAAPLRGEVEVDESCFGGKRKGKRGRGARGKVPVFGLLKRGGRIYMLSIPTAKAKTLLPIIESRVVPDRIVYTDRFASYDVLDVSRFRHQRINHGNTFADGEGFWRLIYGIESFWSQAKQHFHRYNGVPRECEWCLNGAYFGASWPVNTMQTVVFTCVAVCRLARSVWKFNTQRVELQRAA